MQPVLPIGQRVRTTVHSPAAWPGAPEFPAGSLGDQYGVAVDIDPDMPAGYGADEITAI